MKIALLAVSLALPLAGTTQDPEPQPQAQARPLPVPDQLMPNALGDPRPGCTPIIVQVAGENRVSRGTRLDQPPPAKALLAVDRQVDGCREVTFVSEAERERLRQSR